MATIDDFVRQQAIAAMNLSRARYASDNVMQRLAPPWAVRLCRSYRQACRLAWELRGRKNMTRSALAAAVGVPPSRISDYLSRDDSGSKRDLPAGHVAAFQRALDNTAVSQWLCNSGQVTVIEEIRWEQQNPDLIPRQELRLVD